MRVDVDALAGMLVRHGLILRGGFNLSADEACADARLGPSAKSVVLIGHAGSHHWPHFQAWRALQPKNLPDPLDAWSREVIGAAAQRFRGRAVSPSDRPCWPFQQWAMRAEGLKPSPLGILMHPRYGLWHAYRGALLFDHAVPLPTVRAAPHLCDACVEKPCLKSCPVGAYQEDGYAYQTCLDHVRSAAGTPCRTQGCLDRNACPHGASYRYGPAVQAFHMKSFASL